MQRITLDAEAGQLSAELARHGIAANARVHVLVASSSRVTTTAAPTWWCASSLPCPAQGGDMAFGVA